MFDQLRTLLAVSNWWSYVIRIESFYILAWLVHRLAWPMAGRIVRLIRFSPPTRQPRPERRATVQSLIALVQERLAKAGIVLVD